MITSQRQVRHFGLTSLLWISALGIAPQQCSAQKADWIVVASRDSALDAARETIEIALSRLLKTAAGIPEFESIPIPRGQNARIGVTLFDVNATRERAGCSSRRNQAICQQISDAGETCSAFGRSRIICGDSMVVRLQAVVDARVIALAATTTAAADGDFNPDSLAFAYITLAVRTMREKGARSGAMALRLQAQGVREPFAVTIGDSLKVGLWSFILFHEGAHLILGHTIDHSSGFTADGELEDSTSSRTKHGDEVAADAWAIAHLPAPEIHFPPMPQAPREPANGRFEPDTSIKLAQNSSFFIPEGLQNMEVLQYERILQHFHGSMVGLFSGNPLPVSTLNSADRDFLIVTCSSTHPHYRERYLSVIKSSAYLKIGLWQPSRIEQQAERIISECRQFLVRSR